MRFSEGSGIFNTFPFATLFLGPLIAEGFLLAMSDHGPSGYFLCIEIEVVKLYNKQINTSRGSNCDWSLFRAQNPGPF
jgi:hypothetical protein